MIDPSSPERWRVTCYIDLLGFILAKAQQKYWLEKVQTQARKVERNSSAMHLEPNRFVVV